MAESTLQRAVFVDGTAKNFRVDVKIGPFSFIGDAPREYGGGDEGPGPYDYLLISLGTCTAMAVGVAARNMKLPLDHVRVKLTHRSIHAVDCEDCHTKEGTIEELTLEVELTGPLSEDQRQTLLHVAEKCPVSQILTHEIKIQTLLVTGPRAATA